MTQLGWVVLERKQEDQQIIPTCSSEGCVPVLSSAWIQRLDPPLPFVAFSQRSEWAEAHRNRMLMHFWSNQGWIAALLYTQTGAHALTHAASLSLKWADGLRVADRLWCLSSLGHWFKCRSSALEIWYIITLLTCHSLIHILPVAVEAGSYYR